MRSRIQNCKKSMKFDSFICDLQIREHRFIVSLWLQKIKEHPRNQNCMLCDLYLCLKSFLAIKSDRKSNLICSLIRDLQIVGGHICNVCLMTILSSQKQNVEYRFWLRKGGPTWYPTCFLIRDLDPQIVGGCACYVWFMTILSRQKLKT